MMPSLLKRRLREISGVGEAIAEIITRLHRMSSARGAVTVPRLSAARA